MIETNSTETISISTQAVILPPATGQDVDPKLIHCPDFKEGSLVIVMVGKNGDDQTLETQAKVKDFSDRFPIETALALPHQMFPDYDPALTDDLIKEGATIWATARRTALPDHADQLTVDHYLDGKTETEV
jgi:hypothetical protein